MTSSAFTKNITLETRLKNYNINQKYYLFVLFNGDWRTASTGSGSGFWIWIWTEIGDCPNRDQRPVTGDR